MNESTRLALQAARIARDMQRMTDLQKRVAVRPRLVGLPAIAPRRVPLPPAIDDEPERRPTPQTLDGRAYAGAAQLLLGARP